MSKLRLCNYLYTQQNQHHSQCYILKEIHSHPHMERRVSQIDEEKEYQHGLHIKLKNGKTSERSHIINDNTQADRPHHVT